MAIKIERQTDSPIKALDKLYYIKKYVIHVLFEYTVTETVKKTLHFKNAHFPGEPGLASVDCKKLNVGNGYVCFSIGN